MAEASETSSPVTSHLDEDTPGEASRPTGARLESGRAEPDLGLFGEKIARQSPALSV